MTIRLALVAAFGLLLSAPSAQADSPLWQEPSDADTAKMPRCHATPIKGVTVKGSFRHDRGCKYTSIVVGKKSYKDFDKASTAAMRMLRWNKRTAKEREQLAEMWTRRVLARVGNYRVMSSASGSFKKSFSPLTIKSQGDKVTLVFWINSTIVGMIQPTEDVYTQKKIVFGKGGRLLENTFGQQVVVPRK